MPDRVVKESIGKSDSLARVSLSANMFWALFLTVIDDHGCFDARPAIVRARLFPLRKDVTDEMIDGWILEYLQPGIEMIRLWVEPNGVRYGACVSFELHNDLIVKRPPTTPCPPWLRTPEGLDPRLGTETLQAFQRISVAIAKLSSGGEMPTHRQICAEAKCSGSTLVKFRKHRSATGCYTSLPGTTSATPQNQNQNTESEEEKYKAAALARLLSDGFERLWQRYPVKDGRKEAERHFSASVKTEQDLTDIDVALTNYLEHVRKNEWKRPKNGKTWFNNWRDWVNWVEPAQEQLYGTHSGNGNSNSRAATAPIGGARPYTPKQ